MLFPQIFDLLTPTELIFFILNKLKSNHSALTITKAFEDIFLVISDAQNVFKISNLLLLNLKNKLTHFQSTYTKDVSICWPYGTLAVPHLKIHQVVFSKSDTFGKI